MTDSDSDNDTQTPYYENCLFSMHFKVEVMVMVIKDWSKQFNIIPKMPLDFEINSFQISAIKGF